MTETDKPRRNDTPSIGECEHCGGDANHFLDGEHVWKCSNVTPNDELRELVAQWHAKRQDKPEQWQWSECADKLERLINGETDAED